MMHEFLTNNREDLTARCRRKVALRPGRSATHDQLANGVPMLLDQLIRTLQLEQTNNRIDSTRISGPAGGGIALSEVRTSAAQHGKELLALEFTVDQVVHDYGDLCQAITDLAIERDAPFAIEEFQTLNRCLDNAIADAVSEFSYQRDFIFAEKYEAQANERIGQLAHDLRNLLNTAILAFSAGKTGGLGWSGATGAVLERSLTGLQKIIFNSLEEVRDKSQLAVSLSLFSLNEFIAEVKLAADLSATETGCPLTVLEVAPNLAIAGSRELLLSAVANLLQNAFKFTHPHTEVTLTAYAAGDRILIDVKDNCGGLPPNSAATMFLPFTQGGANRTGGGLGLTISKQAVHASGGELSVQDISGIGCVFTINLPRHEMPTEVPPFVPLVVLKK